VVEQSTFECQANRGSLRFLGVGLLCVASLALIASVLIWRGAGYGGFRGFKGQMTLSIHVAGLEAAGVSLIPPDDVAFDSRVRSLVPRWADLAFGLKPFVVVIGNQSKRTIVAYTVEFRLTRRDGTIEAHQVRFEYPDAVAGSSTHGSPFVRGREISREISIGEQRVVGLNFEIVPDENNAWLRGPVDWAKEQSGNIQELAIGVDAVLFDDGLLVGKNTSRVDEHFLAFLKAQQDLYRGIVAGLDRGASLDDAFSVVPPPPKPGDTWSDEFTIYPTQAAGTARYWRRAYGDAAVGEIFRKALRNDPFVIRESSK